MPQHENKAKPEVTSPITGEVQRRWAPESGWAERLSKLGFGRIEFVESTGSTNADMLKLPFEAPVSPPALRWAGYQEAGRGRRGRRWVGRPGAALTFSVAIERLIEPSASPSQMISPAAFSLVAGLVVAQAIESAPFISRARLRARPPQLKWPNDVLLGGAKVAGILVEVSRHQSVQRLVVGCGLNLVSPDPQQLIDGPARALSPVGLLDAGGQPDECTSAQAADLVCDIAARLQKAHEVFFRDGLDPFRADWLRRHAFHKQAIQLSDADKTLAEGVCTGIASDGAILIRLPDGERAFALGELSARPVAFPFSDESAQ
ncbi:MAG: biotin--[acetyl-CoA-carboxylase] ligase [Burkholderiaceae bacterium]